jgi:hypothetical protein
MEHSTNAPGPARWYATAVHGRYALGTDGGTRWVPADPHEVHFKRPGQAWTACGLATQGWEVFWDLSIAPLDVRCEPCRAKALNRRAD